jgi:hypothetical protein
MDDFNSRNSYQIDQAPNSTDVNVRGSGSGSTPVQGEAWNMRRIRLLVIAAAIVVIGLYFEATISSFITAEVHRLFPPSLRVAAPAFNKGTSGILSKENMNVMVRLIFTVFALTIGARIMLTRHGYEEHHRHFAVGLITLVAGYWLRSVA